VRGSGEPQWLRNSWPPSSRATAQSNPKPITTVVLRFRLDRPRGPLRRFRPLTIEPPNGNTPHPNDRHSHLCHSSGRHHLARPERRFRQNECRGAPGRTRLRRPHRRRPVTLPATGELEVAFSPHGGCTALIVKVINSAQHSIRVLAYSFTSAPIAKALVEAHKRGVDVRVVVDKSQKSARYTAHRGARQVQLHASRRWE